VKTGVEEIKIIEEETVGIVYITENTQHNRINADLVVVAEGIKARLFGSVNQLIVLKKDCRVFVHGAVHGKIENQGGRLFIYDK
jgi:hypothetical protein